MGATMTRVVSMWTGDCLQAGKPSRFIHGGAKNGLFYGLHL